MGKVSRAVRLSWDGKAAGFGPAAPLAKARPAPECVLSRPDGSALYFGDNVAAMAHLGPALGEKVTLAYLDPPFLTGRVHEAKSRQDGGRRAAFDDRWEDRAAYLEALAPRLCLVRELLAPHGSVVVHVDPKTSHYVKVMMDEIFGDACFASEIVWRYRRWPARTPNFQRVHDVMLRYRKDASVSPRFVPLYEPLAPSTLATWGTRKQRAVVKDGRRLRSSSTSAPTPGVPMGDVWDVGVIAPVARERTGYPSQKPEALLERLVGALSAPGEIVLDPYAGSGTTLAVAARMGRVFVGVDASPVAIETAAARLEAPSRRAAARV